jgi:hypothetical protein
MRHNLGARRILTIDPVLFCNEIYSLGRVITAVKEGELRKWIHSMR